jgi:hypothetical protein
MHGAIIDTISDTTFESIAERAARYPVAMRKGQLHRGIIRTPGPAAIGDPALRWLLLNTYATTRSLKGTG